MPKILTLIIAAAIIYAVMDAKSTLTPATVPTPTQPAQIQAESTNVKTTDVAPEMQGGMIEKTLSKVMINVLQSPEGKEFISKVITTANTPISGEHTLKVHDIALVRELFHIEITNPGSGPKVSCGHTVNVDYKITNSKGVVVESGPKTFRLGNPEIVPGLSNVIVGMQKGESRKAILHKSYSYDSQYFHGSKPEKATDYYYVNVTLLDMAPDNFAGDYVKIFDDEIAFSGPYLCGDLAVFDAKIMKTDGTVIYDSEAHNQKIQMHLGDNEYPMIFSHALFSKVPVGVRSVICKGENLKSFGSDGTSKIFPKAQVQPTSNDFFLIEFSRFKRDSKK